MLKKLLKWIKNGKSKKKFDIVESAGEGSFPASDPPVWTANEVLWERPEANDKISKQKFLNQIKKNITVDKNNYQYFSLPAAEQAGLKNLSRLPVTLKILLENLLRHLDGELVTMHDVKALVDWLHHRTSSHEIVYHPARVLMQDFTGVPAIVDLAAMRAAIKKLGGDPEKINPLSPVDLVIDHSVQVDQFIVPEAFAVNATMEMERNYERYEFLRWGQTAFRNFRVVPPETGICHQVNLEYLGKAVWSQKKNGELLAYPDTLVGTDSHTTMINGLGILGWGVGGIEAEAAMLGQPISMVIPEVIGVKLYGKLKEGITATDLVLTVTRILREKGVVGKFVEFFGKSLNDLSIADRATIGNMSPEYGATCGFFPIDEVTLEYLRFTGRDEHTVKLVEAYSKAQGLWHDVDQPDPVFTEVIELDLGSIRPSLAGPKRPQDQVELYDLKEVMTKFLADKSNNLESKNVKNGDVVIAAITSCTNTSNPSVLIGAGLLAKKAVEKGLTRKSWVKTSFAPGSKVVTEYLEKTGLQKYLNQLGFTLVGYGCTTCIGNSGPLPEEIANAVTENDLTVSAVLSGNRNFEGRIHPQVKANWLASPPLVVVFALTGTTLIDLTKDPIANDSNGNPVYLKDLWPSNAEIAKEMLKINSQMFQESYSKIFTGPKEWQEMKIPESKTYEWQDNSTYIQEPPFFQNMQIQPDKISEIKSARILAMLGDSITTDHISPAGSIKKDSPAGKYLISKGVEVKDFNSYGSRRGNHEVMMRGTFANIRIRNEMVPEIEGGFTKYIPINEVMPIYDAAMRYQENNIPLIIIAGKEYGTGSSRDWAAKGPKLLGVAAVIAESFERIHRSNLIGMGIVPLEFIEGATRKSLNLTGFEKIDILGVDESMKPHALLRAIIYREDGSKTEIQVLSRIDTQIELSYYKNGGILQYVIRGMV